MDDYFFPSPLAANIWANNDETVNGIDSDSNGKVDDIRGWDFVDNDNDPYDFNSHGTHVSGTIAAVGNNSKGVVGVNWRARIMPLRVLDASGSGFTSNIVSGIEYAIANGAHIINASIGGPGYSQAMKDVIDAAGDAGVLFVAAAGNENTNNDGTHSYPSDYNSANIVSVAATDSNDALASFSNYGSTSVDIGAPGVNTYSTVPKFTSAWSDNFADGNVSDWTTGGTGTTWGLTNAVSLFDPFSLTDSVVGNYQNNSNNWARSPAFNLSGLSGCQLNYFLVSLLETNFDFLFVEASTNGVNFSTIQSLSFFDNQFWYRITAPMGSFDGQSTVYVRFRLTSDANTVFDGVYIDHVDVSCVDSNNTSTYDFKSGTSMAAPHVTGLAALILAKNNTLTVAELKALILDHGDSLPTLSGKTTTGKRINAFTSISNTPAIKPPTQPPQNQDTGTGYGHTCFTNSDNKVMCWGAL
ncbi:S8 family serine peptidase [Methyloprofundus sp.]|uniref:S8 family peptidase n=1 Tax=Methyloprofundus sp. TaxID=2020875 RepID=UPI003D0A6FCE